ncbi:MAG TPA: polysaccharide biosynthesis protein [Terriglobales bacterium]
MNLTPDQICWNGRFPQPSTSDDPSDFVNFNTGKDILVTGAGGSIGSAPAKTIHRFRPRCLLLIDASEQALYRIYSDLSRAGSQCHVPMLGSIADERCLRDTFQSRRPEIIYNAGAFKHVPLTEMNSFAVVHNNVLAMSW